MQQAVKNLGHRHKEKLLFCCSFIKVNVRQHVDEASTLIVSALCITVLGGHRYTICTPMMMTLLLAILSSLSGTSLQTSALGAVFYLIAVCCFKAHRAEEEEGAQVSSVSAFCVI